MYLPVSDPYFHRPDFEFRRSTPQHTSSPALVLHAEAGYCFSYKFQFLTPYEFRDCRQISLLILSKFEQINEGNTGTRNH